MRQLYGTLLLLAALAVAEPAAAAFVDNGDGTVSDTVTGLMWDQCAVGQTGASCEGAAGSFSWSDALHLVPLANAVDLGRGHKGYHDWRLPNIAELESLVNLGTWGPAIDAARFPNTLNEPYWSSTIYAPSPAGVHTVDFRVGNVTRTLRVAELPVRLVRGGQPAAATDLLPDVTAPDLANLKVDRVWPDNLNTLNATSTEDSMGYWVVVARGASAPVASEIIAGTSYRGVTVLAGGSGPMEAGRPTAFPLGTLPAMTAYDLWLVAQDGTGHHSAEARVQFATVPIYTLAATATPAQGGSALCTPSPLDQGSDATCTYTVDPAYSFVGWSGDCTGPTCTFTAVAGDKHVTANFSFNQYPITATANPAAGGAVTCDPNPVGHGSSATCTYTPNPGYRFTAWSGGCSGATCTLTDARGAANVTANFAPVAYSVTASSNPPAGGETPPCTPDTVHYDEGSTCTTAAHPGYVFVRWTGACAGQPETCTLTAIRSSMSSAANFAPLFTTGPINDTGLGHCWDGTTLVLCNAANAGDNAPHPRQDARFGRDASAAAGRLNKTGAGAAGFDFTALDTSGQPVPPGAHACVRDNLTGLVWSVETLSASRAGAGAAAAGQARCGYTVGWRVPTRRELLSIVHNGAANPAIDAEYFPATAAAPYWSADAYATDSSRAWYVDFADGSPAADANGTNHAFRLVVNDVNHAPAFTKGTDQTALEDSGPQTVSGWATAITSGDPARQSLRFILEHDNPALFAVQPAIAADGTLTYTPAGDAFGRANVTVRLADDGGIANGGVDSTVPETFIIDVLPVNDAPTISLGANIDLDGLAAPARWRPQPMTLLGWATNISAGEANEADQSLSAMLTLLDVSGEKAIQFSAAPTLDPATGTLSFTVEHTLEESYTELFSGAVHHLLSWFSSAGLTRVMVTLKDDGGTANGGTDTTTVGPFTIALDPVPKAVEVSVRSSWQLPCVPVTVTGWDADTTFRVPADYRHGVDPYPFPTVRINSLPANGFLTKFLSSRTLPITSFTRTGAHGVAAAADGSNLELSPASAAAHKAAGFNFYGSLCYVPFQSTFTGFDSFTFVVVDPDGNESSPGTVTIEIFEQ